MSRTTGTTYIHTSLRKHPSTRRGGISNPEDAEAAWGGGRRQVLYGAVRRHTWVRVSPSVLVSACVSSFSL